MDSIKCKASHTTVACSILIRYTTDLLLLFLTSVTFYEGDIFCNYSDNTRAQNSL